MLGLKRVQLFAHVLTHLTSPVHQVEPLELIDGRHGGRESNRVRFIRMPVREEMVLKVFCDLTRGGAKPKGHISRSDAFGSDQNIRLHPPMIHGKPCTRAAPTRHDLIRDQQDTMTITYLAQFWHV